MTNTNSTGIRALTVRQPWASLIAFHGKTVENRTWPTRWRGTLLVHAANTADPHHPFNPDQVTWNQVRGAVIAVTTLEDCHADDGMCTPWSEDGAFHWELDHIRPLARPVLCAGRLGLWTLAPDVLAQVTAQIGALP